MNEQVIKSAVKHGDGADKVIHGSRGASLLMKTDHPLSSTI